MSLIPDDIIEQLKREISIASLAKQRGIELKKHGDELIGLCPFHDDKNPSLVINPHKNLWHCLGVCQTGGSVIDWVMRVNDVEFREAVLLLQGVSPVQSKSPRPPLSKGEISSIPFHKGDLGDFETSIENPSIQTPLNTVINYYHKTLKQNADALSYLKKRCIDNQDAIDTFKLGYCDRTLFNILPDKTRKEGAEIRGALESCGMLRATGHEHFRGSIVIPVINEDGVITEVYGRKISTRLRKGTPLHLYLPGPHRGIFNVQGLMHSSEIILCESLIDALTFWCAGFKNVTCAYGIEGFTKELHEAFLFYGVQKIYIAYDNDEAGNLAAKGLSKKLIADEIECYRINFPKGMDANSYAQKVGPVRESLALVINKAELMGGKCVEINPIDVGDDPCVVPHNRAVAVESDSGRTHGSAPTTNNVNTQQSSVTPNPAVNTEPTVTANEIIFTFGERKWRVRGLEKNMSFGALRVNIMVGVNGIFHVDTFDLCVSRHRQGFIKQAAFELELTEDIIKKDVGKLFLSLEQLQEKQIYERLNEKPVEAITLTDKERTDALALLKTPDLSKRILEDFEKCGVVGEQTNKLVGYLSAVSRKLEQPLAVVIQSSSAAGKSALMESILSFLPSEEQVKYSAMTGQSLFYMGETNLKHKILAIVEEEGAERAAYALKLLQSEGELTIASTGKDPATGRLVTQEYRVEGPVMIFLTTTAIEIDEELLNRCIVLTVDENREQTRAIHKLQRKRQTLHGLLENKDSNEIKAIHQNAQRLLKPLLVANPFADELTFLDSQTRTRRDHMKYLTLIRACALLHQYQRPIKQIEHNGKLVDYIDVTLEDIELINGLCHQVLGRSLDELAPQTRNLLVKINEMVKQKCEHEDLERCDCWFTRREVREYSGFGSTQVKIHMQRLEELEYIIAHRGGRGQQFLYELVYEGEGQDGTPFLSSLLDVEKLKKQKYDTKWSGVNANLSGVNAHLSGPSRPQVGGVSVLENAIIPSNSNESSKLNGKSLKSTSGEKKIEGSRTVHEGV